jgi:hypothetical protein
LFSGGALPALPAGGNAVDLLRSRLKDLAKHPANRVAEARLNELLATTAGRLGFSSR